MTSFAFRYRLFTWLCLVFLLAQGYLALQTLSRREDPDISPRNAQITAILPGASAAQVEQLLLDRLERSLLSQDEIKKTESVARPGFATINLEARDDCKNLDQLWHEVRQRVDDLRPALPEGSRVIVNDRFSDASALIYAVVWPQGSERQREDVARRLRDRLRNLTAAADVALLGEQGERVEVALSSAKMANFRINVNQIVTALARHNLLPDSGGSLNAGPARLKVETGGQFRTLADVGEVVLQAEPNQVRLADIAEIRRTFIDPPQFSLRANGSPAVAVSVTMRKGENILTLGDSAAKLLAEFRKTLPAGAEIIQVNDLATSVQGRISEFNANLRDGVIIILLVTYLFMGLRSAALVGFMLPLTILGTFALMLATGRELQQMSITALIISLGLVVDNSVVVIDNIEHKMAQGVEAARAALEGTREIQIPLLTSNLTTVAAFLPLASITGGKGEFIADLGYVTTLATLVSLVLNATILPLLAARFLRPVRSNQLQTRFFAALDALREVLSNFAQRALVRPATTVAVACAAALLAVLVIPHLGVQFFPSAQRNQFRIDVWLPEGSDIRATAATVTKVEDILKEQSGVRSWVAYIGRGGPRFYYNINPEPPASNYAQLVVNTASVSETARLVTVMREQCDARVSEARIIPQKLEQGPPLGAPISIRLSGEDLSELRRAGDLVKQALAARADITSCYHDFGEAASTLQLEPDLTRLAQMGLTPSDIALAARLSLSGLTATSVREGEREIPVELRLPAQERQEPLDLAGLYLFTGDSSAQLSQLAGWKVGPGEGRIARRNHLRTLTVSAHVAGDQLPSQVLAKALPELKKLDLPARVQLSYGGEQEEVDKSFRELTVVFFVTVVAQLAIVAWEFNEFKAAATILAAVPLSLSGAILGLFVTRNPFGFTAFLGLITLGGVVTNHAIMLFEYARAEKAEQHLSSRDALLAAGRKRLRPILLTVLLSIGGLLPLGIGGGNLWPPMAWSLIFGLALSVILAVVIVPALYTCLESLQLRAVLRRLPGSALLLGISLLLVASGPARADQPLTLESARAQALKSHPALTEYRSRLRSARLRVDEAYTIANPTLQMQAGYTYLSPTQSFQQGPLTLQITVPNNYSAGVSLRQALHTFGRLKWSSLAAQLAEKAAQEDYQREYARAWEEVSLAYFELAQRQEEVRVARLSREVQEQTLKDALAQEKAGTAAHFEVLRAQAALSQSQQSEVLAESAREASRARLVSLLGQKSGTSVALPASDAIKAEQERGWQAPQLEGSLQKALQQRPEIVALRWSIEAAQAQVGLAESQDAPTLNLQSDYVVRNQTGFQLGQQWTTGVVLSVPLFDGGAADVRAAQAREAVRQLQASQEGLERQIRVEVESLYYDLLARRRQLDVAASQLEQARESERVATLRYHNGLSVQLELLDSQRQRSSAELLLVTARYQFYSAQSRWQRALGELRNPESSGSLQASPPGGSSESPQS